MNNSDNYKTSKNSLSIDLSFFNTPKIGCSNFSTSTLNRKGNARINELELIKGDKEITVTFNNNNQRILKNKSDALNVDRSKKAEIHKCNKIISSLKGRKLQASSPLKCDLFYNNNIILALNRLFITPKFQSVTFKSLYPEVKYNEPTIKLCKRSLFSKTSSCLKERNLIRFILLVFLFLQVSCKDEEIVPLPEVNKEHSGIFHGKTVTIDSSNLDFLGSIKSNATIKLDKNYIYELLIPIQLLGIENFVLDGNGATLKVLFNGKAIDVSNCSDITIKNFKIDNGSKRYTSNVNEGRVHVSASTRVLIDSLKAYEQLEPGNAGPYHQILLKDCSFSVIQNSNFEHSRGELITLESSSDCVVKNNKTNKGWSGIATKGSRVNESDLFGYRNHILNNEVYNAEAASITINDRETVVENNLIQSTIRDLNGNYLGGPGIRFGHYKDDKGNDLNYLRAVGGKALNNKILNFTKGYEIASSSPVGIKVDATTDINGKGGIIIEGNTISNCLIGISVSNEGGQRGSINSNNISVLNQAIELYSGVDGKPQDFLVRHNNILSKHNANAIKIRYSNVLFENNTVITEATDPDIYCIEISNNSEKERVFLINNRLKLNGTIGIFQLSGALDNAVIANNSISNAEIGMVLKCRNTLISNNIIDSVNKEGISLWNGSEKTTIVSNKVSTFTKSCIYLRYTNNIEIDNNTLTNKGKAQSSYAIFFSDGNTNKLTPSLNNKYFNYPYHMRYN